MATYQYRCADDGDFDISRPIGTATPKSQCPACSNDQLEPFIAEWPDRRS